MKKAPATGQVLGEMKMIKDIRIELQKPVRCKNCLNILLWEGDIVVWDSVFH